MAIANITNNILTDSGVATSSLLTTSAAASTYLALAGGTLTGALSGTSATFSSSVTAGGTITLNNASANYATLNLNGAAGYGAELKFGEVTGGYLAAIRHNYNVGTGLEFYTGGLAAGNLRMYISPTGNVGIGTSTPSVRLDLGNNVGTANTANQIALYGGGQYGFGVSAGHLNYISGGAHSFYNTATSATQMLITSDGNLLLGTTDNGSGAKLVFFSTTAAQQLKAAGTAPAITFSNTITSPTIGGVLGAATGANQFITGTASGDMVLANQFNTGALIFGTSNTERMRILSGGQLNINSCVLSTQIKLGILQTQNNHVTYLYVNNGSGNASVYARIDSTGNAFAYFDYSGTVVGSITTNGSTTSYNITSDYRLKQDFKNYKALDLISAIKTYDYEWKSDKSRMYGVIAHELQEVIPYAVTGKKDGEQMQGVDYSKIVPILIKSIQELKAEIETLKNK